MSENIKVRWLVDHEQIKIAPKTLSTQILNEDGTLFKDTVENEITNVEAEIATHASNGDIHVTAEEKEAWSNIEIPSLEGYATEAYVESLVKKLSATLALSFYCIEDVTIIINGVSKVYPANSNVEIVLADEDVFEIVPTSNNSILSLNAFPGALSTYYPWLEGVKQFSNILFDMNNEDMYSKWSQGNQGAYQVQFAQYANCVFWSDNPYISDVAKRTNYTLCSTSQLPLCYSTIPDNTFKSFYLAFNVTNDPNWSNSAYKESFAKATWATQAFSYYGARIVGFPGHDSSAFNITLPKDCRGLMFDARNIECAGTFDAVNVTNFGAKSGSWREAFGDCISLRRLYIKNLKVGLNISWSPIDYDSISYIISAAANTSAITISVSPYTYNLLSQDDFDLAASKNITIELLTTNYVEDKRLSAIADKADKDHNHDNVYETKTDAQTKLDETNNYMADITASVDALNTLVGDTSVSEQINSALETKADASHSHDDINAVKLNGKTEGQLSVAKAVDSDKLGGQLPSYYATAASVSSITADSLGAVKTSNIVNNFTTTSSGYVADARALKTLNDNKIEMELLWENASPSSTFVGCTLTFPSNVNIANYNMIYYEFANNTKSTLGSSVLVTKGRRVLAFGYNLSHFYRIVTFNTSSVVIGGGYAAAGANPGVEVSDDTCCVPLRIYGIKEITT